MGISFSCQDNKVNIFGILINYLEIDCKNKARIKESISILDYTRIKIVSISLLLKIKRLPITKTVYQRKLIQRVDEYQAIMA